MIIFTTMIITSNDHELTMIMNSLMDHFHSLTTLVHTTKSPPSHQGLQVAQLVEHRQETSAVARATVVVGSKSSID